MHHTSRASCITDRETLPPPLFSASFIINSFSTSLKKTDSGRIPDGAG